MFANSQLGGINFSFPDICLLPPVGVPTPFLNVSYNFMAISFSPRVLWMCTPAHMAFKTKVPISFLDQPGVMLGLLSKAIMGPTEFITGAFTVFVNKRPATRMTSLTLQNRRNMLGMTLVPGQCRVLLLCA